MRTRSTTRRTLAAIVAVGAALAAGAVATASAATEHDRGARPAEARAITTAVKTTPTAGLRAVRNRFNVTRIRVSTRSPFWATADIVAKPAFRTSFQGGYAVLLRLNRADRPGPWVVVDAGSATVACGIAPTSVLRDLGRGGCPPGERV